MYFKKLPLTFISCSETVIDQVTLFRLKLHKLCMKLSVAFIVLDFYNLVDFSGSWMSGFEKNIDSM